MSTNGPSLNTPTIPLHVMNRDGEKGISANWKKFFNLVSPCFVHLINLFIVFIILFPILVGLTLNLFIETAQYVPEVSQAAGARIVIHNHGEMPFPDEDGINLVPGFSTSVGVRRVLIVVVKNSHI